MLPSHCSRTNWQISAGKRARIGSRLNLKLYGGVSCLKEKACRECRLQEQWIFSNTKHMISYDWGSCLNIRFFGYFPEPTSANSSNHLHCSMAVYCKVSIKVRCFTFWPLVFLLLKNNKKLTFKGYRLRYPNYIFFSFTQTQHQDLDLTSCENGSFSTAFSCSSPNSQGPKPCTFYNAVEHHAITDNINDRSYFAHKT